MKFFRQILEHPVTDILVAIILIGTGIAEGWETFFDDIVTFDIGVHHGVLLYGVVSLLKSILELFEGVERMHKISKQPNE